VTSSNGAGDSAGPPADEQHELMAAAMADPVRSKIFLAVAEPAFHVSSETAPTQSAAGVSIRQISERVRENPRRVRYHLDVLCRQGLVELVEEKRQRGVIEHFFRSRHMAYLTKEQLEAIPSKRQQKMILELLKAIFADATAALESGAYVRRPEWAAGRLHADVDEQGWKELGVIFEKNIREALDIIDKSQQRLRQGDEQPIRIGAASLLFEAAASKSKNDSRE
jgi:DNA-binding transcriptional ArsR family regulator